MSVIIWYLSFLEHTFWNCQHNNSSYYHLNKVNTTLLTIFLILYIISLKLLYFIIGKVYLFMTTYFLNPFPAGLGTAIFFFFSFFCVHKFLSVFCLFWFLDSTCKWNNMVIFSAMSDSIIPCRFIHVMNGKISVFFMVK